MKTLVIVGHPNPSQSHVQQFLFESIAAHDNVTIHPLANLVINKQAEQTLLKEHDRIIFQFPVYWYSCPCLLKEWIDTVIGSRLDFFKGKELGIVATLSTQKKHYAAGGRELFTVSEMLRPFEMIANALQMRYLPPFAIHQFEYQTDAQKKHVLMDYQRYVTAKWPMTFKEEGEWLIAQLRELSYESVEPIITYMEDLSEALDDLTCVIKEVE